MITPNSLHFERSHSGVPDIDPDRHRLLICGAERRSPRHGVFSSDAESRRERRLRKAGRNRASQRGFGCWAVEASGDAPFIGYVGLAEPRFDAHFTPCVEIGWRLAREHWGRGYATEGATAVLNRAFGPLGLPEVVSYTAQGNRRSRSIMRRLGMSHCSSEDFDHPGLPGGHALRRHVLYRLKNAPWRPSRVRGRLEL